MGMDVRFLRNFLISPVAIALAGHSARYFPGIGFAAVSTIRCLPASTALAGIDRPA